MSWFFIQFTSDKGPFPFSNLALLFLPKAGISIIHLPCIQEVSTQQETSGMEQKHKTFLQPFASCMLRETALHRPAWGVLLSILFKPDCDKTKL